MQYDLCEDLIVEIFTRLPTKSLLRFRSASKSLCACIGSSKFIQLHTLRSPNKLMIRHQVYFEGGPYSKDVYTLHSGGQMSCEPSIGVTIVDYPFTSFLIVGSCNGIVCLYQRRDGIYLWNPSIRRMVTRPSLSDPEGNWAPLGFGFDPMIDDYKILMSAISQTEKGVVVSTIVYTMKTSSWREIASPTTPFAYSKSSQCLFNGALHWAVIKYLNHPRDDYHYILTFDLSSEVFSTIELPEPTWETNHVMIINGSLAVISSKHGDSWIWVRDETVPSWSVAFKLNTNEFEGAQRVFQLTTNDDLLFNPIHRGIIVYNPESRARSRFVGLKGSSRQLLVTPCIESLELLDMGTSCK